MNQIENNHKKPKLLITASTFPRWSGDKIPLFVYELALSLIPYYDIHVLAPHFKGAKQYEVMDGIKVHRFVYFLPKYELLTYGSGGVSNLSKTPSRFIQLFFYIIANFFWFLMLQIKFRFKVVNIHWIVPTGLITLPLKFIFRYKVILTSHGGDVFGFKKSKFLGSILNKIMGIVIARSESLIVVSKDIKLEVLNRYSNLKNIKSKVSVIPMGINYQTYAVAQKQFNPKSPIKLLFVGRLAEKKGVKYLIDALDILKNQNINFELTIAGDGIERESLESKVNELKLKDSVNFLGYIQNSQLVDLYKTHDILIGSSIVAKNGDKEGLPVVYMEAMAGGMPIIATDVGGTKDLITNLENGIVIEQKNALEIAQAVIYLIENKELTNSIINNAIKTAKFYDWKIIADKFNSIFKRYL